MAIRKTLLICEINWTKTSLTLLLFLSFFQVRSQKYSPFLQGQAAYLYYNPAFAGSTGFHRFALAGSMSGSWFDASGERFYTSYDQYFSKLKAGFGILATNIPWYFGNTLNKINYSFFEVMASPKVRISKKMMLSFGLSFSVTNKYYNAVIVKAFSNSNLANNTYVNYSAGVVLNSKTFYLGYSLRKYTPLISSFDTITKKFNIVEVPALFSTLQGGMILKTNQKFNFAPSFIFQMYHHPLMRGRYDISIIGNFKYKKLFWAVGLGSSNVQLSAGYYGERFRIGYSKGFSYNFSDSAYLFITQELFLSYTFDDFSSKLFILHPHSSEKEDKDEK